MANINLDIADAQLPRVVSALCRLGGFSGSEVTGANAKAVLVAWVRGVVDQREKQDAIEALSAPTSTDIT